MARGHNVLTIEWITKAKKAINDNAKLEKSIDKVNKKIDSLQKKADAFNALSSKLRSLQNLFLGMGLAALFFGMAVKNAAQNAIKGFVKTWATVMEGSTMYNETLGRLNASFQFLKFAIADAFLTSELGQNLIDTLIRIMDWISSLSPETLKWIGILLVTAFVVGAILMIFGQLALALLGVIAVASFLAQVAFTIGAPFLLVLLVVGLIFLGIFLIVGGLIAMLFGQKKIAKWFFIIAAVVLGIALILAIIMGAPIIGVIALIGLVVALALAFVNASDEFKLSFLKAVAAIGKALFEYMIFPIRMLLKGLALIPGATGRMARSALGVLDKVKEKIGMEGLIGGLEAKIAARQAEQAEEPADEKGIFDKIKTGVGEMKEGVMNQFNIDGDIVMPEGTDMNNLGEGIKEESLHNAGAGTG